MLSCKLYTVYTENTFQIDTPGKQELSDNWEHEYFVDAEM